MAKKRQASEPKRAFENGDFFTERKRSKNAKASVLANEVIGVAFRRIGSGFAPLLPPESGEREGMERGLKHRRWGRESGLKRRRWGRERDGLCGGEVVGLRLERASVER